MSGASQPGAAAGDAAAAAAGDAEVSGASLALKPVKSEQGTDPIAKAAMGGEIGRAHV